jgi:GTP-binding protein EngB required for normal cell division
MHPLDPSPTQIKVILESCSRWLATYPEEVRRLLDWANPLDGMQRLRRYLRELRAAEESLEQDLCVAVCGENNAGKSTLVNAILGQEIAPADFFETRIVPIEFAFGTTPRAVLENQDSVQREIAMNVLNEELRARMARGEGLQMRRVYAEVPSHKLKGMRLVDVPGMGADAATESVAIDFQSGIDAAVFVVNASRIGQAAIESQLKKLIQVFDHVAVVINKIDNVGFEQGPRAAAYFRQKFGARIPVFPLAAKWVLQEHAKSAAARESLEQLEMDYLQPLIARRQQVKAVASLAKCLREMRSAENLVQSVYRIAVRDRDKYRETTNRLELRRAAFTSACTEKIEKWFESVAFVSEANLLHSRLALSKGVTKDNYQDRICEAFTDAVFESQNVQLAEFVQCTILAEQRKIAEQLTAEIDRRFIFKTEATLARLRASGSFQAPTSRPDDNPSPLDIITGSAGTGLTAGTLLTILTSVTTGTAIVTAASGVGIPAAVIAGATALFFRVWDVTSNRLSSDRLKTWIDQTRQSVAVDLKEKVFPQGVSAAMVNAFDDWVALSGKGFRARLWANNDELIEKTLQETAAYLDVSAKLVGILIEEKRLQTAQSVPANGASVGDSLLSAAALRARELYLEPAHYRAGCSAFDDLMSVLALEDSCVDIVDRSLTGEIVSSLSVVPSQTLVRVLTYDIEENPAARTQFLQNLRDLRCNRDADIAVRVIRFAEGNRTPLDRVLIGGDDWLIECSDSLKHLGTRDVTITWIDTLPAEEVRILQIFPFWANSPEDGGKFDMLVL